VVLLKSAKVVAEHQPTRRVSVTISAMRVEFSPVVVSRNPDPREIADAGDLDILWGLNEMNSLKCSIRNEPGPVSWPSAPGNDFFFSYTNGRVPSVRVGRAPDAEVACAVDEDVLAL